MSQWFCKECGNVFTWIRKGINTKPEKCPECKHKNIVVRDV